MTVYSWFSSSTDVPPQKQLDNNNINALKDYSHCWPTATPHRDVEIAANHSSDITEHSNLHYPIMNKIDPIT